MPVLVSEIVKTTNGQITNRGIYNFVYYLLTVYKNFEDNETITMSGLQKFFK